MPDRMTDERIAELRALCEKATAGPWSVRSTPYGDEWWFGGEGKYQHEVVVSESDQGVMVMGGSGSDGPHKQDAAFIVSARTALPEALKEVERQRSVIKDLLDVLTRDTGKSRRYQAVIDAQAELIEFANQHSGRLGYLPGEQELAMKLKACREALNGG